MRRVREFSLSAATAGGRVVLAFYLAGFKIADHCRLATRALFVVDTDRRVRCARATDDPERLPDVDCARCSNGSERHSS